MKKLILSAVLAFCTLGTQSYALTNSTMADQFVSLLSRANVNSKVVDAQKGAVVITYNTEIGTIAVCAFCNAETETITFGTASPLHVDTDDARQMVKALIAVNAFNSSNSLFKAYIDTDDGQLMFSGWTNAEDMPSPAALSAICELLAKHTAKLTSTLQEEL